MNALQGVVDVAVSGEALSIYNVFCFEVVPGDRVVPEGVEVNFQKVCVACFSGYSFAVVIYCVVNAFRSGDLAEYSVLSLGKSISRLANSSDIG